MKTNISSETRNSERNNAAIDALSVLMCWNDSSKKPSNEIRLTIMELSKSMQLSQKVSMNPKNWKGKIATKLECIKWLIANIADMMCGTEEAVFSVEIISQKMGIHSCRQGLKGAQGDSFETEDGQIYSIVASCGIKPKQRYHMIYGLMPELREKAGRDAGSMEFESDDNDDLIRIRKHSARPVSYDHWDIHLVNHKMLRAKISGPHIRKAKGFFKMIEATKIISDYAQATK